MSSDTSEKGFQKDFINYLTSTGYVKRTTKDYNVVSCLDVELVLNFIHTTQPKAWKKFAKINKSNPEVNFIKSLILHQVLVVINSKLSFTFIYITFSFLMVLVLPTTPF